MAGWFGSRKQTSQSNVVNRVSDGWAGWLGLGGTATAPALTHKTALEQSTVLACVKIIAEGVASAPIRLIETYSENGLDKTRIAKSHPAHKLLQRPNGYQTSFEFIEGMVANAVLGKGALAIKVQVGNQVRELLPVPSGVWVQEQLANGQVNYRVTYSDGTQHVFGQNQVVFFRGLSLDGYSSVSAIESARIAVGIANSLETSTLSTASSNGRPSGILSFENGLSEEARERLRELWQSRYRAGGEGGVAVMDSGSKFTAISQTAVDSQFIENRRFQINEIARIFGVQPAMLGVDGAKLDQNILRIHIKTTLMPWFKRFEQALNRDLIGKDVDRFYFDFDEMDLLRGDYSEMTKLFDSALGKGGAPSYMTVNEIRFELGLNPSDEDWCSELSRGGYGTVAGLVDDSSPSTDEESE